MKKNWGKNGKIAEKPTIQKTALSVILRKEADEQDLYCMVECVLVWFLFLKLEVFVQVKMIHSKRHL